MCPLNMTEDSPHMLYMGKDGRLKGGTRGPSFLKHHAKMKELLTTKFMDTIDFGETLVGVFCDL